MAGILGFEFRLGPEVPPPHLIDFTVPPDEVVWKRHAWATAISEAVRCHDAWGVLRTRPDGDVTLFDAVSTGSLLEATGRGGTVHLLLAREARREALRVIESPEDLRALGDAVLATGRRALLLDRDDLLVEVDLVGGWPTLVHRDRRGAHAVRTNTDRADELDAITWACPLRVLDGPEVPR